MKLGVFNPFISSILAASLLGLASSQAAVTLYAEYHLGEAGSLSGVDKLPQDSSGNAKHITGFISGSSATVGTSGVFAPGSTAYLDTSTSTNQGWVGDTTLYTVPLALTADDFAFGVYARAGSNAGANLGDVFTIGGANGAYTVALAANGWAASRNNVAWIGNSDGYTGSFSANTWAHLALIRSAGTTTFYINGIAQTGATTTTAPVIGAPHFSVKPGGGAYFDGQLDEARIVTFTSGETTTNIMNKLTAVPEPRAALLGGLGMLMLLRRRRA